MHRKHKIYILLHGRNLSSGKDQAVAHAVFHIVSTGRGLWQTIGSVNNQVVTSAGRGVISVVCSAEVGRPVWRLGDGTVIVFALDASI